MDLVAIIFDLIGIGRDRANRASDRRAEVARLNAEISGEAGRALDMLISARARMMPLCIDLYRDSPEVIEPCTQAFEVQETQITRVLALTADLSQKIATGSVGSNWNLALQRAYEMRATATRFVPSTEDIIRRFDTAIEADAKLIGRAN